MLSLKHYITILLLLYLKKKDSTVISLLTKQKLSVPRNLSTAHALAGKKSLELELKFLKQISEISR